MIGRTLLQYTITKKIGTGAMGQVYLAHDTRADRPVALKFLGHATEDNPEARERLIREARAAARLLHPNIVTLYGVEETSGDIFLVQEFVEGETLARRIARGPLTGGELRRLARELADALAHAHRNGVLHRDLKPDNVLVTSDGHFKIADFGIAHVHGTPTLTEAGTLMGTLAYLAPERLEGNPGDERADLFALGAILYEAISGQRAFKGESQAELLYAVMTQEPAPLEVTGQPHHALAELAQRLLAKDPNSRPMSADQVAGLLEGFETTQRFALPRRRRHVIPLAAAALALVVAGVAWRGREALRPAVAADASVAVLAFENVPQPTDPERLGSITSNLLISSLAQTGQLTVLGTQTILDALRRLGKDGTAPSREVALAIARRTHAGRIVTGNILQVAPTIIMTAEVSDVRSGRILGAARVEGEPEQTVFQVVDALSGQLMEHMVRTGHRPDLAPVAERASGNLDALRSYVSGIEALSRGELSQADSLFGDAVSRDAFFPQAYYQRALTKWWQGQPVEAVASIEKARTYSFRLSPTERAMLDGLSLLIAQRWPEAIHTFQSLARTYPEDKLVLYGLVEATFHGGHPDLAVTAARRALAVDPDFLLPMIHLVDGLSLTGHTQEAEKVARDGLRREPQNSLLWLSLFNDKLIELDTQGALAVAHEADAHHALVGAVRSWAAQLACGLDSTVLARRWIVHEGDPDWKQADAQRGLTYKMALYHGNFAAAIRVAEEAWRAFPTPRSSDALYPIAHGVPAAFASGDVARGIAWSDSITARSERAYGKSMAFSSRLDRVVYYCELHRPADARAALLPLTRLPEARMPDNAIMLRSVQAELALAEGRPRAALEMARRSNRNVTGFMRLNSGRAFEARCYAALGLHAQALAEVDSVLAVPLLRLDEIGRLHYLRAQTLENLHRPAEAVRAYERFLQIWNQADPTRPEIRSAQAALRRLRIPS
jgi:tetratricopeptide (TPR) repeat protein